MSTPAIVIRVSTSGKWVYDKHGKLYWLPDRMWPEIKV